MSTAMFANKDDLSEFLHRAMNNWIFDPTAPFHGLNCIRLWLAFIRGLIAYMELARLYAREHSAALPTNSFDSAMGHAVKTSLIPNIDAQVDRLHKNAPRSGYGELVPTDAHELGVEVSELFHRITGQLSTVLYGDSDAVENMMKLVPDTFLCRFHFDELEAKLVDMFKNSLKCSDADALKCARVLPPLPLLVMYAINYDSQRTLSKINQLIPSATAEAYNQRQQKLDHIHPLSVTTTDAFFYYTLPFLRWHSKLVDGSVSKDGVESSSAEPLQTLLNPALPGNPALTLLVPELDGVCIMSRLVQRPGKTLAATLPVDVKAVLDSTLRGSLPETGPAAGVRSLDMETYVSKLIAPLLAAGAPIGLAFWDWQSHAQAIRNKLCSVSDPALAMEVYQTTKYALKVEDSLSRFMLADYNPSLFPENKPQPKAAQYCMGAMLKDSQLMVLREALSVEPAPVVVPHKTPEGTSPPEIRRKPRAKVSSAAQTQRQREQLLAQQQQQQQPPPQEQREGPASVDFLPAIAPDQSDAVSQSLVGAETQPAEFSVEEDVHAVVPTKKRKAPSGNPSEPPGAKRAKGQNEASVPSQRNKQPQAAAAAELSTSATGAGDVQPGPLPPRVLIFNVFSEATAFDSFQNVLKETRASFETLHPAVETLRHIANNKDAGLLLSCAVRLTSGLELEPFIGYNERWVFKNMKSLGVPTNTFAFISVIVNCNTFWHQDLLFRMDAIRRIAPFQNAADRKRVFDELPQDVIEQARSRSLWYSSSEEYQSHEDAKDCATLTSVFLAARAAKDHIPGKIIESKARVVAKCTALLDVVSARFLAYFLAPEYDHLYEMAAERRLFAIIYSFYLELGEILTTIKRLIPPVPVSTIS